MQTLPHTPSTTDHTEFPLGRASDCRALAEAISDALSQLAAVVGSLDATQFCCKKCDRAFGASVGRHVRHVLDHVGAIERAALATSPTIESALKGRGAESIADYEARARDTCIEREPALALAEISRLQQRLRELAPLASDRPATILIAITRDAPKASIPSTLGRELSFVLSHTIHHHAILRTMICELGLADALDPGFGLAPGTPITSP